MPVRRRVAGARAGIPARDAMPKPREFLLGRSLLSGAALQTGTAFDSGQGWRKKEDGIGASEAHSASIRLLNGHEGCPESRDTLPQAPPENAAMVSPSGLPEAGSSAGRTRRDSKESTIAAAELSRPVILAEISPGRYNLIDGNHRMAKITMAILAHHVLRIDVPVDPKFDWLAPGPGDVLGLMVAVGVIS